MADTKLPPNDKQHGQLGPNLDVSEKMIAEVIAAYKRLREHGVSDGEALSTIKKGYYDKVAKKFIKAGWLDKTGKGSEKAKKEFDSKLEEFRKENTGSGKSSGKHTEDKNAVIGNAPGDKDKKGATSKQVSHKDKKEKRAGEHWIEVPSRKVAPNAIKRRKVMLDSGGMIIGGDVPKVMEGQNISDKDSWNALTNSGSDEGWGKVKEKRASSKHKEKKNKSLLQSGEGTVPPDKVYQYLKPNYPEDTLGWVKHGKWHHQPNVNLEEVQMSRRPGGRDLDRVKAIEESIKEGKKIDPVVLVKSDDGKMKVVDGYHRLLAYKHLKKDVVHALVGEGFESKGLWDKEMHERKLNKSGIPIDLSDDELTKKAQVLHGKLKLLVDRLKFKHQLKAIQLAKNAVLDTVWGVLEGPIEAPWTGRMVLVTTIGHYVVIGPDVLKDKHVEDFGYNVHVVKMGDKLDPFLSGVEGTVKDQGLGITDDGIVQIIIVFYTGKAYDLRFRLKEVAKRLMIEFNWSEAKANRFIEGVWERINERLSKKFSVKTPAFGSRLD